VCWSAPKACDPRRVLPLASLLRHWVNKLAANGWMHKNWHYIKEQALIQLRWQKNLKTTLSIKPGKQQKYYRQECIYYLQKLYNKKFHCLVPNLFVEKIRIYLFSNNDEREMRSVSNGRFQLSDFDLLLQQRRHQSVCGWKVFTVTTSVTCNDRSRWIVTIKSVGFLEKRFSYDVKILKRQNEIRRLSNKVLILKRAWLQCVRSLLILNQRISSILPSKEEFKLIRKCKLFLNTNDFETWMFVFFLRPYTGVNYGGTCSFICQDTSTRRQRSDLFGLRVKLPPVTTSLDHKFWLGGGQNRNILWDYFGEVISVT